MTIDLTAATTPTAVVQARGRALRVDAGWPQKIADNWAVVCVTDAHPKGGTDYDRFVRKHDRYFALSADGDIASGVAHVDPELSPFEPPAPDALDGLNARMLMRVGERTVVRQRWAVAGMLATIYPAAEMIGSQSRAVVIIGYLTLALGWAFVVPAWLYVKLLLRAVRAGRTRGTLEDMALATADALHEAGLTSRDARAVRIEPLPDGGYRARLDGVPATESATFAAALDEVLAPLGQPRYIVPRYFVESSDPDSGSVRMAGRMLGSKTIGSTVVYHAVPTILGVNKKLAETFARAWRSRVSAGDLLYTGSPEGTGILAAARGDDPFAITTRIRTLWR